MERCYHGRTAAMEEQVDFFRRRLGTCRTLVDLLALGHEYRRSFAFVIGCLPTLARLHLSLGTTGFRSNRPVAGDLHGSS
jgi:hypothetical protein